MNLRKILILFVGIFAMSTTLMAQGRTSVLLSLKNGSRIKCNIVEVTPKQTKVETSDGSIFVYSADQVLSIVSLQNNEQQVSEPVTPPSPAFEKTSAQQSFSVVSVAEPEYAGEIVYVKDGNETVNLESQTIKIKTQGNAALFATGIGTVTTKYEVEGRTSPVRITTEPGDTLRFICSTKDNSENPRDYLAVFKMEQSRKRRFAEVGKASTFGGVESKGNQSLSFKATKYGDHSYLIELWGLQPGEYGVNMTSNPSRVFCFSLNNNESVANEVEPSAYDYDDKRAQIKALKREMDLSEGKSWRVNQGGYKGFVDLAALYESDIDEDCPMISTSHGYQFGSYLFLGGGIGFAYINCCNYYHYDGYYYKEDGSDYLVPLFFDARVNFLKSRFSPVFGVKLGCDLANYMKAYYDFSFGCKFRMSRKLALNLSLRVGGVCKWTDVMVGPSVGFEW